MTILPQITQAFARWMDAVAGTIIMVMDRFGVQQRVQVIEGEADVFALHPQDRSQHATIPDHQVRLTGGIAPDALPTSWATALRGARTELILKPSRFLFRPLELPRRASEFLDGIVRSQIDRLTPWTASEALFGWTPPAEAPDERIVVTVAATARGIVMPYVEALARLGAASIVVSTTSQGSEAHSNPIRIFEQHGHGAIEVRRVARVLTTLLLLASVAAGISITASAVATGRLEAQQQDLSRRIAARRAAMRAGRDSSGLSPQNTLQGRKNATPSSVVVLEALSQLLPDHTYVTELRIEGDKLQVIGITRDAPSLIELIEQSPHFARATFFAPTTRSPDDPGERFHIEARIKPVFKFGT
jgi:general secretion pathway protein L